MSLQDWPKLGQYVDFKDRDQVWQVGLVIFKNQHCLKIRSQGWCQKYDEIIPISEETNLLKSAKIQPFRTIVRGYTGQRKAPTLRQHWKYSRSDHTQRLKKLEQFTITLKQRSPEELTQFLRGQHYFYIDFLMNNIYTQLEDIVQVYQYFSKHIHLLQNYLTSILQRGIRNTFINLLLQPSEQQLWDKAYHSCFYQLIEATYNIAGLQDRLTYFIHNNEPHIKEVVGMYQKHQHYISTLVQNSKLYDSIIELIAHTYRTILDSGTQIKLPFCYYFSLYQLFQIVQNIFRLQNLKQESMKIFDQLFQVIKKGVEQLDPNSMKEAQIERQIEYIIVNLRLTAVKYKRQEKVSHWPERLRMKICMLLLKCDKLQKKIKGVSKLKDIADKIIKEQFCNFNPEEFTQLLHTLNFFEELFIQNQHVELYKKSVEFVGFLYKYEMISVEQLYFVWKTSINKHPMIVTPLLQFWIDMASSIDTIEMQAFARIVIVHYLENKPQNPEFLSFFLEFTLAIIISASKCKDSLGQKDTISKVIAEMTNISYGMVVLSRQQNYFPMLVSKFGIIVIESPSSNSLIDDIFKRLEKQQEFQVCLQILHQVYVSNDKLDIHAPQQVCMKLIDCLQRHKTTLDNVRYILSIMNCIISGTNKMTITNKEFQTLWEIFQSTSEECKTSFYQWILPMRSQQIYENISSHINIGFNYSLKKFILSDILSNETFISYSSLTKKELSIVLQLFIEVNLNEGRLQRKKILQGYRFIHRVKSVQLSSEAILWSIFEKCKQSEVIQYLNRYIIKFYFYLSPALSLSLRKSRVDDIMEKVIHNIKGGNQTKNNRLVRHSLSLLKYIFELVREDEKYISLPHNNQQTKYYIKLEIRFSGHTYRIEVPESDTIMHLKCRLAQKLKLKFGSFKIMAIQQGHASTHSQELDFVYKNISVLTLRRAIIEIVQEQDNFAKFVSSFIDEGIENLLITMLENQAIATEVFMVIEEIELKFDKAAILSQINSILEREEQSHRKMLNIEVYYHLLQIKIYNKIMETEEDILSFGSSKSFQRILKCMKYPIQQSYQITFVSKLIQLFTRLLKKASKNALSSLNLQEYMFASMLETVTFLIECKSISQQNQEYSIKIAQNLIYIIEVIVGSLNLVNFLVSQPELPALMEKIYLNHQVEEVRMLFTEKINICLTTIPSHPAAALSQSVETYLLHLFVDNVYFKIKDEGLKSEADCGENDAVNQFCNSLALIIRNIDASRFQKTQIIQPIEGRSSSLFEQSTSFIESLKLFTTDFHWSSLLCGHLNILSAIYYQQPSLLSQDIIVFVLQYCLGLTSQDSISKPLCKKPQHISQAFKFLFSILHINKQKRFIKAIISKLKPCHQLEYWRTMLHWNINLKQQAKQDYRGLLNPGCICYLNSLLQQLYMIDSFRNTVLGLGTDLRMLEEKDGSSEEIENKPCHQNPEASNEVIMIQSLKEIFLKLKFSEENSINPTSFAKTIKTNDNKPLIKFNEQMDIDEFASIFFQKIERGAKYTGSEDFVKKTFGGVYAHQIISKECTHKSEREQQFISISLQVKQTILKSFESLVKTQILDGSNKYHCEKCDKKVKAEKIQTIKQLPPYLILCLKRFQFDYEIDAKIKINDYCQFPQLLNLQHFSQQQILKSKQQMVSEDEQEIEQPPQYFNYRLRGVVVHTGSADSGHYYSFIDNGNGSWYQFNDQEVLPFELDRLPEEAFGSRSNRYDLKTKNAYLLLYERTSASSKQKPQLQQIVLKRQENMMMIQKIKKKNRDLRKFQMVFSDEYQLLIRRLQINLAQIQSNIQLQIPWFQFELSYYFLVKARKDNISYLMVFSKAIENKILSDPAFCVFFLNVFASPKFIEEFFIFNPLREKCKIFGYLLEVALQKQYQRIKHKTTVCKNEYLFKVFACLKAIFIHHSLISQLLTTLRKFLDHLLQADDYSAIYQIIQNFGFEKVVIYTALSISFDKKLKAQAEHYCVAKELEIGFLATAQHYGRKQHHNNYSEAWKITTILLNFCNQFLQRSETQMEEKRDLYLNLMSNLKHCFGQQNIQNKIISLMMESSSLKAIYYFYYTLKELKLHFKILPAIEKALKDFESIKFRPFFLYLETAITDKDTTPTIKAKILDIIERAYKINEKFFLQTDLIHQWILRLVSFDEEFLEALEKKRTFIQEIINRISKNLFPSTDLSKKFKHQVSERITNRCLGIMISIETKQYEVNSIRMKKQFEDISNFDYRPKKDYRVPEDYFKVGEQIQYFDVSYMKWKGAKIQENNFGQLTLVKDGKDLTPIYLWEDSQKIRKILPNRAIQPEVTPCESDISCESSFSESPQK